MKVGVVSDTHLAKINLSRPLQQEFVKKVEELFANVDLILHAGDVGSLDVLDFLGKFAPVKAVYGNMDDLLIRRGLPEKLVVEVEEARIGLTHGSGPPWGITSRLLDVFREESIDCLVFGHTHEPFNKVVSGILMFNPGSPTDTIYASQNSLGLLIVKGKEIKGEIVTF